MKRSVCMETVSKKPTEETNTSPGTESDSAVSNMQNTEITVRTETIGEVSFDISSLWTREDQNGAACYYRYFDKAGNYEAFILVDANTAKVSGSAVIICE